ncbi:uncharacterized protein LOC110237706 [Exaiptasia diaphana]|uniref:Secreted protein n=1 Tax=Exaiptasia diaphana TaxID=2652724 RepID=A0A913X519_EXADI|nr:uncharacterized protein LOC110237706 [Exaiptasia diaphana]KXJ27106.1 hypothetical protein AC249_AIPGENE13707 [Exaiptasia diaphana]
MTGPYILILLTISAFITLADLTNKPCQILAVNTCLSAYIQGFQNQSYSRYNERQLHCRLDKELALCADKFLKTCPGGLLASLGRAVISYVRFDRQNGVCRWPGYYPLLKKLSSGSGNARWMRKYDRLVYQCTPSSSARQLDLYCIKAFVQRMRKKADLCQFIPFKYNCLRKGQKVIQSDILDAVLDIFPEEADKVLKVLCQKER